MHMNLAYNGRKLAKKGIFVQCVSSMVMILVVLFIKPEYTTTVAFGAITFIIPHSFFAYWSFRYVGATKNRIVAQSFSQGLKIKLAMTTVFFAIAFSQLNAPPFPLIGAYVIVMLSQWFAMAVLSRASS